MSDHVDHTKPQNSATPARRGQSLVEFALVLPMLLVLLLGVVDFGRVFQAGIALEAAARNAAEVGALERLRNPPPADPALRDVYYENLHRVIAEAACDEMRPLPPPDDYQSGPACQHLTGVAVCVQDGTDTQCGVPTYGMDTPAPATCDTLDSQPAPPWPSSAGDEITSHSVDVHLCYQFSTLWNLNIALPMNTGLALGDVYLERSRSFVIDCPDAGVSTC